MSEAGKSGQEASQGQQVSDVTCADREPAAGTRDSAGTASSQVDGDAGDNQEREPDEDYDGPPAGDGNEQIKIPGGLAGLKARKEAERARLGMDPPTGGRVGEIKLPYQDVRRAEQ
ncbi:hypothetical protein OC845_000465 [Tilletia horrida]|nr:hypothetical protein OC845_000465 [Tilletia horrida]